MAEKRIGVGVVGIGWVSHPHIDAWLGTGQCDVVALCSHSEENARAAAAQHGLKDCRIYTDYEQMLRQDNLDLVDICSLNASHAEQGIAAAQAGKHVLVEKPVAMTLDELRRLERAITQAGVKSLAGFVLHWSPYFEIVKTMIQHDFFGKLYFGQTGYISGRWPIWYKGYYWARTRKEGGNSLLVAGCHAVDALRQFMTSDVDEVMCYAGNFTGQMDYDATMAVMLRFADGTIGQVLSMVEGDMPYSFTVRLHGTKGTLVQNRFYSQITEGQTDWAEIPTIMPDTPEVTHHPFAGEMKHFVDCILHEKTPMPDIKDAVKTHEIIFAAEQSAQEGKPIKLPFS
jgi:predicted dehydrogenase